MKFLRKYLKDYKLRRKDQAAGQDLTLRQDNTGSIRSGSLILVSCLRNEQFRMPFFMDYYRKLGVDHFLFIDNDSTDGFQEWAADQADVSVWYTQASYKDSNFGMLWCNELLRRYGSGRWCVTVDPDEFLVYPYMETRSLKPLTRFLEDEGKSCLHSLTLDAYSDRPLAETVLEPGEDPFRVCPYFDRDGYIQRVGWGDGTWIQGGPRQRVHFRDTPERAPALNKIPLIKWRRNYHYRMSMHDAYPRRLNHPHPRDQVALSAALFHFKFVSTLEQKVTEEARRREHYAGGQEYDRYLTQHERSLYQEGLSVAYEAPEQLVSLGLMSPGRWF